ncbi:MAG TPA: ester cyclase [Reyranella sp.]
MTPRQAVEAFYDRVWNRGDKAAIPELIHDDFTFRGSLGPTMTGHAAFSTYVDGVTEALADYRCTILDVVSEGERAFARMRFEGIHRAPFLGLAPTGRRLAWAGAALFTLKSDKIVDLWVLGDLQGLREQLQRNAEH